MISKVMSWIRDLLDQLALEVACHQYVYRYGHPDEQDVVSNRLYLRISETGRPPVAYPVHLFTQLPLRSYEFLPLYGRIEDDPKDRMDPPIVLEEDVDYIAILAA